MPNNDCPITDDEVGLLASTDPADLVISTYVEPTTQPRVMVQLKSYVNGTGYELNRHLVAGSYEDDWLWASTSTCKFQIDDNHASRVNLPCKLVRDMKIRILDFNGIRVIGHWYIRNNPSKRLYGPKRADGSYRGIYDVECVDCWSLMQAKTYSTVYTNQPAGAILKDAFSRAGFDASHIDATAGPTLESHAVIDDYPAAVAEQMMSLLDWSYWFDIQHDPPVPYAGPKESADIRINLEIGESNWYKVFAPEKDGMDIQFDLQPAEDDYANEVTYTYRQKYSEGKATFQNASNVMLGYTGAEDWWKLSLTDSQGGVEVEIPSTGATYKLNKNNSTDSGTNEFILGSDYAEADTVGGVAYIIKGIVSKIKRRNAAEIARVAAIRGGDGVRSKVIVRNDAALTYAEASLVATFELSLYSRQYWKGHGRIPTSYHADWLLFWPGKTLPINLPDSKQIVATVRIEGMRRRMRTERQTFSDGALCPAFAIELQFTPSLYNDYEQIRALFRSQRKVSAVGADSLTDTEFVENILAIKDCVHIVEPITEADPSIAEIEGTAAILEYPTAFFESEYSDSYYPGALAVTAG